MRIPHPVLVHDLLTLLKLKVYSETDNGTEFELQCDIFHGPEWNMEFSISEKTLYRHFSNF